MAWRWVGQNLGGGRAAPSSAGPCLYDPFMFALPIDGLEPLMVDKVADRASLREVVDGLRERYSEALAPGVPGGRGPR